VSTMTRTSTDRRNYQQKIVPFDTLPAIRERHRDQRIVQCHGAFDLVHIGHLIHFEEARALGDILVVTITGDRHITKKRSVSFTEEHRARQVASLEIVDYVTVVPEPSALMAIEGLHPDVYVKGPEYANLLLDKSRSIYHEVRVLESYGGRIHFTSGEAFSSTKLSHFLLASPEAAQVNPLLRNDWVRFRDVSNLGFKLEDVKAFLARAADLRVCVLGETIVDEWVDIAVTNLSTQSKCIAGVETGRVRQIGGVGIIALHLAGFVKEVHCVTNGLGGSLPGNVGVTQITPGQLVETRFVDRNGGHPLFKSRSLDLANVRHDALPDFDDFDLVLIADYGHGLLDAPGINTRIAGRSRAFVAAMAQVNSSNYGYNLPTKYTGASYYSLNRTEAELCIHERDLPADALVERVSQLLHCPAVSVTDGDRGAVVALGDDRFAVPTLSTVVIDTIGCGDAYFALSSLAASLRLPARLVALVGSIGAAAMAQRRCNECAVSEQEFLTIAKIVI
jgi:cytidyltransferase-like protein